MSALIIGVDLATAHFELAVSDAQFRIQRRQRLSRVRFAQWCRRLPPSLILMEAFSSAHRRHSSGPAVRLRQRLSESSITLLYYRTCIWPFLLA